MRNATLTPLKWSPRRWLNFLWAILFLSYLIYFIFFVKWDHYSDKFSGDYRAFYATAQIALTQGFPQVYNLQIQSQYQSALQNQGPIETSQARDDPVPMPYLPAFVLLFLPLPALGYFRGFVIWDLANLVILFAYLYRFNRSLGNQSRPGLIFQLAACLPVASNVLSGQINVFLMVCLGEFFIASFKDKEWPAGLWLGGLLLKPQILIFILPGLLIRKRIKAIAGFLVCGAILLGLSLILVGPYGLRDLVALILQYVHGLPTNDPEAMMNWRSVAIHLSNWLPNPLSWVLAWIGIIITGYMTLSLWTLPVDRQSPQAGLLLLATFAGTFMVSWHSHTHTEIVLIPLILFLMIRNMLPWKLQYLWLLVPPVALIIIFLLLPWAAYNLFGILTLVINSIILVWAARALRAWFKVDSALEAGFAFNSMGNEHR